MKLVLKFIIRYCHHQTVSINNNFSKTKLALQSTESMNIQIALDIATKLMSQIGCCVADSGKREGKEKEGIKTQTELDELKEKDEERKNEEAKNPGTTQPFSSSATVHLMEILSKNLALLFDFAAAAAANHHSTNNNIHVNNALVTFLLQLANFLPNEISSLLIHHLEDILKKLTSKQQEEPRNNEDHHLLWCNYHLKLWYSISSNLERKTALKSIQLLLNLFGVLVKKEGCPPQCEPELFQRHERLDVQCIGEKPPRRRSTFNDETNLTPNNAIIMFVISVLRILVCHVRIRFPENVKNAIVKTLLENLFVIENVNSAFIQMPLFRRSTIHSYFGGHVISSLSNSSDLEIHDLLPDGLVAPNISKQLIQGGLLETRKTYVNVSNCGVGLQNPGNVCYMLAPLQQFFAIPEFRNAIMSVNVFLDTDSSTEAAAAPNKKNKTIITAGERMLHALRNLFTEMHLTERASVSILNLVKNMLDAEGNPTSLWRQEDCSEFLVRLHDKLEFAFKDLGKRRRLAQQKKSKNTSTNNHVNKKNSDGVVIGGKSSNELPDFLKLFQGTFCNQIVATQERDEVTKKLHKSENTESFITMQLELEPLMGSNSSMMDASSSSSSSEIATGQQSTTTTSSRDDEMSLENLLRGFVRGELMAGENAWYCGSIGRKISALKRCVIQRLPNVLIFNLKRFKMDYTTMTTHKINAHVSFPSEIDMYPYTQESIELSESLVGTVTSDGLLSDGSLSNNNNGSSNGRPPSKDKQLNNKNNSRRRIYDLCGIVVHTGDIQGGHYYSLIRHETLKNHTYRWIEYNDSIVRPLVSDEDLVALQKDQEGNNNKKAEEILKELEWGKICEHCFGGKQVVTIQDQDTGNYVQRVIDRCRSAYLLFYRERRETTAKFNLTEKKKMKLELNAKKLELNTRDQRALVSTKQERKNRRSSRFSSSILHANVQFLRSRMIYDQLFFNFVLTSVRLGKFYDLGLQFALDFVLPNYAYLEPEQLKEWLTFILNPILIAKTEGEKKQISISSLDINIGGEWLTTYFADYDRRNGVGSWIDGYLLGSHCQSRTMRESLALLTYASLSKTFFKEIQVIANDEEEFIEIEKTTTTLDDSTQHQGQEEGEGQEASTTKKTNANDTVEGRWQAIAVTTRAIENLLYAVPVGNNYSYVETEDDDLENEDTRSKADIPEKDSIIWTSELFSVFQNSTTNNDAVSIDNVSSTDVEDDLERQMILIRKPVPTTEERKTSTSKWEKNSNRNSHLSSSSRRRKESKSGEEEEDEDCKDVVVDYYNTLFYFFPTLQETCDSLYGRYILQLESRCNGLLVNSKKNHMPRGTTNSGVVQDWKSNSFKSNPPNFNFKYVLEKKRPVCLGENDANFILSYVKRCSKPINIIQETKNECDDLLNEQGNKSRSRKNTTSRNVLISLRHKVVKDTVRFEEYYQLLLSLLLIVPGTKKQLDNEANQEKRIEKKVEEEEEEVHEEEDDEARKPTTKKWLMFHEQLVMRNLYGTRNAILRMVDALHVGNERTSPLAKMTTRLDVSSIGRLARHACERTILKIIQRLVCQSLTVAGLHELRRRQKRGGNYFINPTTSNQFKKSQQPSEQKETNNEIPNTRRDNKNESEKNLSRSEQTSIIFPFDRNLHKRLLSIVQWQQKANDNKIPMGPSQPPTLLETTNGVTMVLDDLFVKNFGNTLSTLERTEMSALMHDNTIILLLTSVHVDVVSTILLHLLWENRTLSQKIISKLLLVILNADNTSHLEPRLALLSSVLRIPDSLQVMRLRTCLGYPLQRQHHNNDRNSQPGNTPMNNGLFEIAEYISDSLPSLTIRLLHFIVNELLQSSSSTESDDNIRVASEETNSQEHQQNKDDTKVVNKSDYDTIPKITCLREHMKTHCRQILCGLEKEEVEDENIKSSSSSRRTTAMMTDFECTVTKVRWVQNFTLEQMSVLNSKKETLEGLIESYRSTYHNSPSYRLRVKLENKVQTLLKTQKLIDQAIAIYLELKLFFFDENDQQDEMASTSSIDSTVEGEDEVEGEVLRHNDSGSQTPT
eukprot:g3073.t1